MDTRLHILALIASPHHQMLVQQARDAHSLDAEWRMVTHADAAQTLLTSHHYDCLLLDAVLPDADLRAVITAARAMPSPPAMITLLPSAGTLMPDEPDELTTQFISVDTRTTNVLVATIRGALRARRAEQHVQLLVNTSRALTASLDLHANLARLTERLVVSFADWCAVDLVEDGGQVTRVALATRDDGALAGDQAAARHAEGYQPNVVLASGQVRWHADIAAAPPDDLTHVQRAALQEIGATALFCVPLLARDQTLGAISVAWNSTPEHPVAAARHVVEEVARRAAIAIDNAQLYRAAQDALRARDMFLSVAAHDLKTPLTTLLGYATLLQRRIQSGIIQPERDARGINTMVAQAQRLNTLLNTLLDVSRMPHKAVKLDQRVCDLAALTARVAHQVRATLHQHMLSVETPHEAVFVSGDNARLELVVRNLVQNAVQHSPAGSPIVVRLTRTNGHARLDVQDHGVGIARDALPRIFGRFYHATDTDVHTVTSMGIGLYVVKQIVELHGGSVAVQSIEGEGSTFTVLLPLHAPYEHAATTAT